MQQFQDLLIDTLLDLGFTLPEAEQIVSLQDRFSQSIEMQRAHDDMFTYVSQNQMQHDDNNHISPQSFF